jgi:uncharacterized protein (DUF697 family)
VPTFNVNKILKVVGEVRKGAGTVPRICLAGDDQPLADAASALSTGSPDAHGGVSPFLDLLAVADVPDDLRQLRRWRALVMVAPFADKASAARAVGAARRANIAVLGVGATPQALDDLRDAGVFSRETAVSLGRPGEAKPTLTGRLAAELGDDAVPLAARLPALRRMVAEHIILGAARQNGVIGAVVFIPGADMPAMTLNQIRMVLRVAAAYDEELGVPRALEILSIVGAGFALRTLARQALDVVPGFGWALKGAVGFSGTVALGRAAIEYFEAGAPLTTTRFTKIADSIDRVTSRIPFLGAASG